MKTEMEEPVRGQPQDSPAAPGRSAVRASWGHPASGTAGSNAPLSTASLLQPFQGGGDLLWPGGRTLAGEIIDFLFDAFPDEIRIANLHNALGRLPGRADGLLHG